VKLIVGLEWDTIDTGPELPVGASVLNLFETNSIIEE